MKSKKWFGVAGMLLGALCFFAILYFAVGSVTMEVEIVAGFMVFAILLSIASILVYLTEPVAEAYFYTLPAIYTGMIYLIVQGIAAFILAVMAPPFRTIMIVELVIAGIMGGGQCYVIFAGLRARELKRKMRAKVSNMRSLVKGAEAILGCTSDYEWQRQVKAVIDDLKYADHVTQGDTALAERQIGAALEALRRAVVEADQAAFDHAAASIRKCLGDRKAMQ